MKNLMVALVVVFALSAVSQQSNAQECSNDCGVVKNTMSKMTNFVKSKPVRRLVKSQPVRTGLCNTKTFVQSKPVVRLMKKSRSRVQSMRCKIRSKMRTNCCG